MPLDPSTHLGRFSFVSANLCFCSCVAAFHQRLLRLPLIYIKKADDNRGRVEKRETGQGEKNTHKGGVKTGTQNSNGRIMHQVKKNSLQPY